MLVAADVYRPAAIDQLNILGKKVGVPVYSEGTDAKPSQIAKNGLKEGKSQKKDVIIVDTAGRLQVTFMFVASIFVPLICSCYCKI